MEERGHVVYRRGTRSHSVGVISPTRTDGVWLNSVIQIRKNPIQPTGLSQSTQRKAKKEIIKIGAIEIGPRLLGSVATWGKHLLQAILRSPTGGTMRNGAPLQTVSYLEGEIEERTSRGLYLGR